MSDSISKSYESCKIKQRLEIRGSAISVDQPTLYHNKSSFHINELSSIDLITLKHLISERKYGMYLIEDKSYDQVRCYNFTPYKHKTIDGKYFTFNINSIYPRFDVKSHKKSVIGHRIDLYIKGDRAMVSYKEKSNFDGHKDIIATDKWSEDSNELKIIYMDQTSAIVSDEMVNRFYASNKDNDWISYNGYGTTRNKGGKLLEYHNHEYAANGAIIAVRGDIKFNNIKNEHKVEAKPIEEATTIGLNLVNHYENDYYKRPVYVLKPKLNNDLSLYAINSELHTTMRTNKTVVIDINDNSVIELITYNDWLKLIKKRNYANTYLARNIN